MGAGKRKERKRTHNAIKCQRQKLLRTRNILQREKKKKKTLFFLSFFRNRDEKLGWKMGREKYAKERKRERERVCECVSGIVQEDDNVSTMVHGWLNPRLEEVGEASERWARVCTQVIETSGGEAPRARVIGNPLLRVAYERDPLGLNNLHGCAC